MLKYFKFYYKSVIQGSTPFTIHPAAKIGYVHLRVSDIQQSLQFYHSLLGFKLVGRTSSSSESVFLSAGTDSKSPSFLIALSKVETTLKGKNDLLFLQDNRRSRKVAGLYHLAILLPERRFLANIFRHLQEHRNHVQFDGFADHAVSESIYLRDPDFNGVEIYIDRPRWNGDGKVMRFIW